MFFLLFYLPNIFSPLLKWKLCRKKKSKKLSFKTLILFFKRFNECNKFCGPVMNEVALILLTIDICRVELGFVYP